MHAFEQIGFVGVFIDPQKLSQTDISSMMSHLTASAIRQFLAEELSIAKQIKGGRIWLTSKDR